MSLNLEVNILGEFKNLTKATQGATRQLKGFQSSVRGISRSINATLATIGVGLSLNALRQGIGATVSEASNLEESINAVQVAFGTAGQSVLDIGNNAATAFGLARSEFNAAAVTFSGFADDVVGPGGDVADFIQTLTQRGADFASVFNIEASEALRVFRSGLSGESEPLKRFGIILNETAVKEFAFARGIAEVGTELTNQQKVLARYQLLLEETSKVEGDFANTSDSLANSLRIARAAFSEVQVAIGQGFTPAISTAAQFVSQNIQTFIDLGEAIGTRLKEAFESTGTSAETFGAKIITTIEQLTAFLEGNASADNPFQKVADGFEELLPLIEGFSALGNGLIEVIKGVFDGLFGWLQIFTGTGDGVKNFGAILKVVGDTLAAIGQLLGNLLAFLIPVGREFAVFGKVLSGLKNPFSLVTNFFKGFGKTAKDALTNPAKGLKEFATTFRTTFGFQDNKLANTFEDVKEQITQTKSEFDKYTKELDRQDNRRITNYIDIVTTRREGSTLIPASPTGQSNFPLNPKPGQVYTWFNYSDRNNPGLAVWWEQTWTGTEWTKPKKVTYTPGGTSTGGGLTTFQQRIQSLVDTLSDSLTEARDRIKSASENFRDAVQLSFGVITNGAFAVFDINRVIRQMKRLVDGAKNFAKDIKQLQREGADQSLIDQLLGMDPLSGAATARGLLSSGRLQEFLDIRNQLAGIGAGAGGVANFGILGTGTGGLSNAIESLTKTLQRGYGNTYTINVNNANKMSGQEIVAAIKRYEKTTGRAVL